MFSNIGWNGVLQALNHLVEATRGLGTIFFGNKHPSENNQGRIAHLLFPSWQVENSQQT